MQQTRHERCRSTVGWLSFSFFLLVSSVSVSLANASTDTWHSHSRISNSTGARFLSEDGQEMVHIVVGLKNDEQVTFKRRTFKNEFKATKAVTMTVPVAEVPEIEQLPQVKYVQEDAKSYAMGSLRSVNRQKHSAMTTESYVIYSNQTISSRVLSTDNSGETLPWGIQVIQGHLDRGIPNPPSGTSFPICIVDSGLLLNHVDVPFSKGDSNIKGEYFGVDPSMPWHSPKDAHGTHVGGVILASAGNNQGVRGVLPSPKNLVVNIARVFGDGLGDTDTSNVDKAVEWCIDQGSKVINLSLGSDFDGTNSRDLYGWIERNKDVLVVAAAGNGGDRGYFYPASYDGVISVAAVDDKLFHASYSQYNDQVTIAAPGTDVLSLGTAPGARLTDGTGRGIQGSLLDFSKAPNKGGITAAPVDCGTGESLCQNAVGKICVIRRGGNSFAKKAANCENAGGVAVVVYNNEAGPFHGSLTRKSSVTIPVIGIPQELASVALNAQTLTMKRQRGSYELMTGTSMSVPHVTGAIAKIWSALPGCTKKQVRQAIIETAKDLGGQGPDNRFGAGLIQVVDAYNYLKNLPAPCGGGDKPAALPSPPGGSLNLEKINKNDRIRGQGGTRQLRGVTEE